MPIELPSRFQINDTVRVGKLKGLIESVLFTEWKIFYYIETKDGVIGPVDSCDVSEMLEVVN